MVASRATQVPDGPPGAVATSTAGDVLTVRLVGEVDLWLRTGLQGALSAVRQHPGRVEVDLRDVTFFGAEGAGALLAMLHARPHGRVRVVGASPAVLRTLRLCGVPADMLPGAAGPPS